MALQFTLKVVERSVSIPLFLVPYDKYVRGYKVYAYSYYTWLLSICIFVLHVVIKYMHIRITRGY